MYIFLSFHYFQEWKRGKLWRDCGNPRKEIIQLCSGESSERRRSFFRAFEKCWKRTGFFEKWIWPGQFLIFKKNFFVKGLSDFEIFMNYFAHPAKPGLPAKSLGPPGISHSLIEIKAKHCPTLSLCFDITEWEIIGPRDLTDKWVGLMTWLLL